ELCRGTANRMAPGADSPGHQLLSLHYRRVRRRHRWARLVGQPAFEVRGIVGDQPHLHERVRLTAELGALTQVNARFERREDELRDTAGDDVALTSHLRHPEGVDDVGG